MLLLTGCDTIYSPMVDPHSIRDVGLYRANLAECNSYASRISVGDNAAGGAVLGALLGAAIGAAAGDRQAFARFGAAIGAVNGAATAANAAAQTKAQIVRNCLAGRGYAVLDGPTTVPLGATVAPPVVSATPPAVRPTGTLDKVKISTVMGMDAAKNVFQYKDVIDIEAFELALEQTLRGEKTSLTHEEAEQLHQQLIQRAPESTEPLDKNKISIMMGMDVADGLSKYKDVIDVKAFEIAFKQTLRNEETALTQEEAEQLRQQYMHSASTPEKYQPTPPKRASEAQKF
jgi:hypothetical protein